MVHIILWEKFKEPCYKKLLIKLNIPIISIIIFTTFFSNLAYSRESLSISIGDEVNIISDKYYRKVKEKYFEAIGNVIITHKRNSLYGEKATISLLTGDIEIKGNVRFIAPEITMYGSELYYNIKSRYLSLKNAKVITNNFIVFGKKISRIKKNEFYAEEAEYTTCKDCPESWSVYGKKVQVTMGEYVRVWHAFFRVKGVVTMYVPYLVLPIKKDRETGLLFPQFSFNVEDGFTYQQPWFFAMSDQNDLTLTPSVWGKRGLGGEFEYRHVLGDRKWFEVGSLTANDEIYQLKKKDDKQSGEKFFRHFSDYEHHLSFGHWFNHHLYFNDAKELDAIRDYRMYTDSRVTDLDLGGQSNFNFRLDFIDLEVEAYRRRNMLVPEPQEFDESYVQILPKLSMNVIPQRLIKSDMFFFKSIAAGGSSDFTVFRQDKRQEDTYIRNANRYNFRPYINWKYFDLGPVEFKTKYSLDYQAYRFPYENEKTFSKSAYQMENEISFELEKIWGLAYKGSVPTESISIPKEQQKMKSQNANTEIVGHLPPFNNQLTKDRVDFVNNSYRHSQIYRLKHYQIFDSNVSGNDKFKSQIEDEKGVFDSWDVRREREHELKDVASRTSIPKGNAIELRWENSFLKKNPDYFNPYEDGKYLRQNFHYSTLGYFNVSQGYNLNTQETELYKQLTRLLVDTGITIYKTTLRLADYYFYTDHKHYLVTTLTQKFLLGEASVGINYDPSSDPVHKKVLLSGSLMPLSVITLNYEFMYDMEKKLEDNQVYKLIYSPNNDCWKTQVAYTKSRLEKSKISFNFIFNYNKNSFGGF